MNNYKQILVALDLTEESDQIVNRAVKVARHNHAELSLIHVVEIVSFAYGGDIPMDLTSIQEQIDQHARKRMKETAAKLGYPVKEIHISTGNIESEIHEMANSINADLIVIGSHGRHGLALLLGSTANGVLHGAKCDILAVRLQKAD